MEQWQHSPALLKKKTIFTLLLGIGIISVALVMFSVSGDRTLLVLSLLILAGCLMRCISFMLIILRHSYETVTGTCTGVLTIPFRKYKKVFLQDEAGNETTLLLGKQYPVKSGACYRFYFRCNGSIPLGNDYLDATFLADSFLGCEEWYPENTD